MENKVKQIMEEYKKGIEDVDKQYEIEELEELDTKELDSKIEYDTQFIEKLKFEGEDINKEMIDRFKERLDKNIEEKNKQLEEYETKKSEIEEKKHNMEKYKNRKVILPSGRETTQKEKDKLDKDDLKNKAIRELTQESINIEEQIKEKEKELELKRGEWNNFKYIYEKDENGNSTGKSINDNEITKIIDEFHNIEKDIADLNEIQKECSENLGELKQPTALELERLEKFSKAWNEAYKNEMKQPENEVKPEVDKAESEVKPEENKTENETKSQVEKSEKNNYEIENFRLPKTENAPKFTSPHGKLENVDFSISKKHELQYVLTYKDGTTKVRNIHNEHTNGMKLEVKSYKQYLKEIKEDYDIDDKKVLNKIDPYLIKALEQSGEEEIKRSIIESIKKGKKVDAIPVTYDMDKLKDYSRLGFLRRKFTKIARNAKDNGFETVNFKDNLYRRARAWLKDFGKDQIETSELKQLEAGKDKKIDPNGPAITTEEQEKMPQVGTAFKENLKYTVEEAKEVPSDKPLSELIKESKTKVDAEKAKNKSDDEEER